MTHLYPCTPPSTPPEKGLRARINMDTPSDNHAWKQVKTSRRVWFALGFMMGVLLARLA